MSLLASLFINPMQLSAKGLWVLIPLGIAVAVVYKTIRVESIRQLPREVLALVLYILVGVVGLMLAGWAVISWDF